MQRGASPGSRAFPFCYFRVSNSSGTKVELTTCCTFYASAVASPGSCGQTDTLVDPDNSSSRSVSSMGGPVWYPISLCDHTTSCGPSGHFRAGLGKLDSDPAPFPDRILVVGRNRKIGLRSASDRRNRLPVGSVRSTKFGSKKQSKSEIPNRRPSRCLDSAVLHFVLVTGCSSEFGL